MFTNRSLIIDLCVKNIRETTDVDEWEDGLKQEFFDEFQEVLNTFFEKYNNEEASNIGNVFTRYMRETYGEDLEQSHLDNLSRIMVSSISPNTSTIVDLCVKNIRETYSIDDSVRHDFESFLSNFREFLESLLNKKHNDEDSSIDNAIKQFLRDTRGEDDDIQSEIDYLSNLISSVISSKVPKEDYTSNILVFEMNMDV